MPPSNRPARSFDPLSSDAMLVERMPPALTVQLMPESADRYSVCVVPTSSGPPWASLGVMELMAVATTPVSRRSQVRPPVVLRKSSPRSLPPAYITMGLNGSKAITDNAMLFTLEPGSAHLDQLSQLSPL